MRSGLQFAWIAASLLACAATEILPPERGALITSSELGIGPFCSRRAPESIDSFWTPTDEDLSALEWRLPRHFRWSFERPSQPLSAYYRQYVGVVLGGRRVVFVNAVHEEFADDSWRSELRDICDGGESVWVIEYDVDRRTFDHYDDSGGDLITPKRRPTRQ